MIKIAVSAALPLLLSACAIPTAVVVASAVDGVTYLSSGKSIASHSLSAGAKKDCSILFGITRGEFCKERRDGYTIKDAGFVVPKDQPAVKKKVAASTTHGEPTETRAELEPQFFDFDYETPPMPVTHSKPTMNEKSAPSAPRPGTSQTKWTLVLGTFADYRSAVDLARQVKPEPGLVTTRVVQGEIKYLVSTTPLKRDQDVGRQLNIAELKLENVKLMPVCPMWMQSDNCIAVDKSLDLQQATLP